MIITRAKLRITTARRTMYMNRPVTKIIDYWISQSNGFTI